MNFSEKVGPMVIILVFVVICGFVFLLVGCKNQAEIKEQLNMLKSNRKALLADFHGTDDTARIKAFKVLVHDESLWPELISVLEKNGSSGLALAFVGKGGDLTEAGVRWAERNGYKISVYKRGMYVTYGISKKK
jgi:hypothetical protein